MNQYKQAADELRDYGNHTAWVAHREADGLAEMHENWADLMFVISGEATLLVGGKIVERKTTSPGEVRGSAISKARSDTCERAMSCKCRLACRINSLWRRGRKLRSSQ